MTMSITTMNEQASVSLLLVIPLSDYVKNDANTHRQSSIDTLVNETYWLGN